MLKNYFTLALFLIFIGNIYSQTTYVPDDNFEQALIDLGYDDVLDDYVLTSNISGVTVLYINNKGISDLTGIEGFTSLTHLNCDDNQLSSLDVSQNTALTFLLCKSNQLTSLNISQNTALSTFQCSYNQLTNLDVSQNTALSLLYCEYNQLTSLDVSQNTNLQQLHCQYNQLISIDVSQNTALALLQCTNNKLIILNANNGNNSLITNFLAYSNPSLACIQVDNETDANNGIAPYTNWLKDATATYSEDCGYSQTTYVPDDNFEQALIDLGIDTDGVVNDNVATVEIIQVTSLNIENKNISDLTGIEDFISLKTLNCQLNQLSNLDVSSNTALTELNCSVNQIISLDLSQNIFLTELDCSTNLLTSLNVKSLYNSRLITFNAISNPDLQCIKIDNDIDANIGLAPYNAWQIDATASYSEACLDPGFTYVPDNNFEQALIDLSIDTDGIINNSVATVDVVGVTSLNVASKNITNLKGIEDFISLTYLQCNNNYGIKLDLRLNTALTHLLCYYSSLTSLDLSLNTALTELRCNNNALTNLDISQNIALTLLKCNNNQLTSLNLSQNTALEGLWCYFNQITSLDLSQNTAFTQLNCYFNKLTSLNIKNGNNNSITLFSATSNPDLLCIQVDNETDANNGVAPYNNWSVDAIVNYSEDCSYSGTTYIPDGNFEQALIDLGIDTDGIINQSIAIADIYQITSLNIENKNISDLTGIEDFISLQILNCSLNQLSNLDFSGNNALTQLNCSSNLLSNLDFRWNNALTELNCSSNLLTSLKINNGHNALITTFNATSNLSLQCISVDNETDANNGVPPYNTWQKDAIATYSEGCLDPGFTYIPDNNFELALIIQNIDTDGIINNSVATIDISGLTTLDVSSKSINNLKGIEDFISLETLYCNSNVLTSLDISQNTALTYLDCYTNQLTSLNVSQNIALERLDCRANQLTSLNVSQNTALIRLSCSQNQITNLDVSQNTSLIGLFCYSNQLTSLDVSKNVLLGGLYCDQNQISNINLNGLTVLDLLFCGGNQLTSLDVSQNIALTRIDCFDNNLTSLDISKNTALKNLECSQNQLTNLDVSQNSALNYLVCDFNQLVRLDAKNGNNAILTTFRATNNPSLQCIQVDNETAANAGQSPYTNWQKDAAATYFENCNTTAIADANFEQALINLGYITDGSVDGIVNTSEISTITTLDVSSQNISDLTGIEAFTSLTTLIVSNNQLTYLDLSYNTNLITLDVSNNPLITLILASNGSGRTTRTAVFNSNINLLNIDIKLTELVTIDISNVPNLESLDAQGSKLIALDVSNNNNLTVLDITNNPLSCVQVNQTQLNNIPSGWVKDASATYSTDCAALGLDDEILAKSITLYPNPVSDILTIDSVIPLIKVEIYSILGQKVKEINSDFNSIPLYNLSKGIYIVRLQSENGFATKKLIKK